jgi:hypothetical protein
MQRRGRIGSSTCERVICRSKQGGVAELVERRDEPCSLEEAEEG